MGWGGRHKLAFHLGDVVGEARNLLALSCLEELIFFAFDCNLSPDLQGLLLLEHFEINAFITLDEDPLKISEQLKQSMYEQFLQLLWKSTTDVWQLLLLHKSDHAPKRNTRKLYELSHSKS